MFKFKDKNKTDNKKPCDIQDFYTKKEEESIKVYTNPLNTILQTFAKRPNKN